MSTRKRNLTEDIVARYRWPPEAKVAGSDGSPCTERTRGLLRRRLIVADHHCKIGKERGPALEAGRGQAFAGPPGAINTPARLGSAIYVAGLVVEIAQRFKRRDVRRK